MMAVYLFPRADWFCKSELCSLNKNVKENLTNNRNNFFILSLKLVAQQKRAKKTQIEISSGCLLHYDRKYGIQSEPQFFLQPEVRQCDHFNCQEQLWLMQFVLHIGNQNEDFFSFCFQNTRFRLKYGQTFVPTFEVFLKSNPEEVRLIIQDQETEDREEVWKRNVFLTGKTRLIRQQVDLTPFLYTPGTEHN